MKHLLIDKIFSCSSTLKSSLECPIVACINAREVKHGLCQKIVRSSGNKKATQDSGYFLTLIWCKFIEIINVSMYVYIEKAAA